MVNISKGGFLEKIEAIKKIVMQKKGKLSKIDLEKLKQIPDEVKIGSKIIKYHPEASVYEEVVRESASDEMNKLREIIVKKLT